VSGHPAHFLSSRRPTNAPTNQSPTTTTNCRRHRPPPPPANRSRASARSAAATPLFFFRPAPVMARPAIALVWVVRLAVAAVVAAVAVFASPTSAGGALPFGPTPVERRTVFWYVRDGFELGLGCDIRHPQFDLMSRRQPSLKHCRLWCLRVGECTHFTYSKGTCVLKAGSIRRSQARYTRNSSCGLKLSRRN